jgi:hypothetical protein
LVVGDLVGLAVGFVGGFVVGRFIIVLDICMEQLNKVGCFNLMHTLVGLNVARNFVGALDCTFAFVGLFVGE